MSERVQQLSKMIEDEAKHINSCFDFKPLEAKSVLITGASGLVGIYFLACLSELSKSIDKLKVYAVIHSEPTDFIMPFVSSNKIEMLRGDLAEDNFLKNLPKVDIIIHSAGYSQPTVFMGDPIKSIRLNTVATLNLFGKLNEGGKFLFLSSSEVYNGVETEEYFEDVIGNTNTTHPRACYIEGKKTGETICNSYGQQGVNVSSVRLSLTYGPGMKLNDTRVVPSLIQKGIVGPIEMLDAGEAKRTFCYIADAVEMMWHIVLHGKQKIYNVGGISSMTIKQLAEIIAKHMHVTLKAPTINSAILGAPKNVFLNMDRIFSEYYKKPFVDIDEGLQRTIKWYKRLANE